MSTQDADYLKYKDLISKNNISMPALLLDKNALDQNIQWILTHSKKNIRIATKSIRSIDVIKYILNCSSRFQGLMCYSLAEALWLRGLGFKDLLVAYPCVDINLISKLKKDPSEITLMVDSHEHLKILSDAEINIAVDLDMSTNHLGLHFGVRRSPIGNLKALEEFLMTLKNHPNLKLKAVMGYEAQIAGVTDKFKPHIKILKYLSSPNYLEFRKQAVELIKNAGHKLSFINGGGAGSVYLSDNDESLTEITVGSLFYASTLFDQYDSLKLKPALTFALQIIRKPKSNIYTCFSGGFIASGSVGPDKAPQIFSPQNCQLLAHEGAGEVQTPVECPMSLEIGDPIIFRHAKAGEICERFQAIHFFENHKQIEILNTYRGQGVNFS